MGWPVTEKDIGGNSLGEGEHSVKVTKAEFGQNKKGGQQIIVEMSDKYGRTAKEFLQQAAMRRVTSFFIAAGISEQTLKESGANPGALIGKSLTMVKKKTGERTVGDKVYPDYDTSYFSATGAQGNATSPVTEEIPF